MSFIISNQHGYVAGLHNFKMKHYNLSTKIKYSSRVLI